MAGIGVAKIVEPQPAETRAFAHGAPARREPELSPALSISRKQEGIGAPLAGEHVEGRLDGLAKRHGARPGLAVGKVDRLLSDVAPSKIEHFAAPASGERQQADRGDGFGPFRLAGVEGAAQPVEFVGVEEPRHLAARVPADAEAGIGVAGAPSPFLGLEHHRAQYLQGAVRRAGPVPARGVEPRGDFDRADLVDPHSPEGGQDAGLEIDAHGPAPGRFPARIAAAQVFVGERLDGGHVLRPAGFSGRVLARLDAGEDGAGAAAGLVDVDLAVAGDDHAPAPARDAGLDDVDLASRRMDAQSEARRGAVEQDDVLLAGDALAGEPRGEVNRRHGSRPSRPRPFRP